MILSSCKRGKMTKTDERKKNKKISLKVILKFLEVIGIFEILNRKTNFTNSVALTVFEILILVAPCILFQHN